MGVGLDSNPQERYCPTCERTFATGERCPDDDTRLVKLTNARDALLGRELDGRYTITSKIGQGAMGGVYRATQHSVGRDVAIKVVAPHLVADALAIKRFSREAKLASRLAHPNAVAVMDFGQTDDGVFYLVMELVEGRTLDAVVGKDGKLPPLRLVRIASQICEGLEGAHRLGIVHRDLKPANVMLLAAGRDLVKVLDFGLAKSMVQEAGATTMTNAGAILGTPAYLAPELVTGGEVDARADLYSLGCTLYFCASGQLPFRSESVHELIAMHANEPPKPLVDVPRALANVIARLLEKEPERRYQNAAETRDALERALTADDEETANPTVVAGPQQTVLGWVGTPTPPPGTRPPSQPSQPITAAVVVQPVVASAPTPAPSSTPSRGRGWMILALALLAIGAGVATFFATR
jgi:serine/threonine-protein kinase